jgi:hypothetical protein
VLSVGLSVHLNSVLGSAELSAVIVSSSHVGYVAVRFVAGLGQNYHTSDAQGELHWLSIEQCITYKLCVIMHCVVLGIALEHKSDMVTLLPWCMILKGMPTCVQLLLDYITYLIKEPLCVQNLPP